MKSNSIPFQKLPFTSLYKSYISDFEKVESFFEFNPFDEKEIKNRLEDYRFNGNRDECVHFLQHFNAQFTDLPEVEKSIQKLSTDDAVAVVTGQQLTLFGGPLFTVFKILTAIKTAAHIEQTYGKPAVPVFWLADEDHDYEEIATAGVFDRDELIQISLKSTLDEFPRVGEIVFDDQISALKEELKSVLYETDFSDDLWTLLDDCYHSGSTIRDSFGKLILRLFSKHGVILGGSNSKQAKELTRDALKKSVSHSDQLYDSLNKVSSKLFEAGFHTQVHVQESNLFWIDDDGVRRKIHAEGDNWFSEGSVKSLHTGALLNLIENSPEKFSPNVFLRPILQNFLLPGAVYVAGPGEVAYYAQMKDFYREFGLSMPIIMPRFSATMVESAIDRVLPKLPFSLEEYSKRIEDLESEYINSSDAADPEPIFKTWKKEFEQISRPRIDEISAIDQSLKGTSEKVRANLLTELDKLKGKVYRSLKEQDKVQLERIRKVKSQLFPGGNLQEREILFIYFMNKYGLDIWDNLLGSMSMDQHKNHNLIHL
ncbi:MAG: bacillithiol biosynthesis cysteine-adding enzyme BshC [Balneolaceae bacterium]|nr:MAG: bacillithiol biosynthesis cysteine-adding enzyme BshC [Balneolaceae bacterium]